MTQTEFRKALRALERDLAKQSDAAEVRKRWREEQGLIYVKTYTVASHLRRVKPRKARPLALAPAPTPPAVEAVAEIAPGVVRRRRPASRLAYRAAAMHS